MRCLWIILPLLVVTACTPVGSNPWARLNYAELSCGHRGATLNSSGCDHATRTASSVPLGR